MKKVFNFFYFSQNSFVFILLLIIIVVGVVFWPLLLGRIVMYDYTVFIHYPIFKVFSDSLRQNGEVLLWNSQYFSGFPSYLSQQGGFLSPITIFFFYFFDFITAFNLLTFANFLGGALAMYFLSRSLDFSKTGSLLSAFVYVFNYAFLGWGSMIIFSNFFPIIPLVFLSIIQIHKGKNGYFLLGIASLALGLVGSFTEIIFRSIAAALFFALVLGFEKRNWRALKSLIIIIFIASVLASPWLLPVMNFISYTDRLEGARESFGGAARSLGEYIRVGGLVNYLYPFFNLPNLGIISRFFTGSFMLYIGILPIFLIVTLLFLPKKRITWFFLALFLFSLIAAMDIFGFQPFVFIHKLPVFSMFRGAWKFLFLGNFAAAILAGYALDKIYLIKEKNSFKRYVLFLKNLMIPGLILFSFLNLIFAIFYSQILELLHSYFNKYLYAKTTGKPLFHYYELIDKHFNIAFYNISFRNFYFLTSIIFVAAAILLLFFYSKGKIKNFQFRNLTLLLTVFNLIVMGNGVMWKLAPRVILDPPSTARFFQKISNESNELFRIFTFAPSFADFLDIDFNPEEETKLELALMKLNAGMYYGIDSISGDERFIDKRKGELLAFVGFERPIVSIAWIDSSIPLQDKLSLFVQRLPFLSMMNVKYILSSFELPPPLVKTFETKVTKHNIPIYIYENPQVLPRVYFAENAKIIPASNPEFQAKNKAFEELLKIEEFKKQTLIECPTEDTICQFSIVNSQFSTSDSIEIKEIGPGYLRLKTNTKNPRWLIHSESNLPTWLARRSSKSEGGEVAWTPLKIYAANYIYMAVFVPDGENEVVFEYPGLWRQMKYAAKSLIN